jgi:hypothetical protein
VLVLAAPGTPAVAAPAPGWSTKTHKRHIAKDSALLARAEAAARGGSAADLASAADALRAHFTTRGAALLAPLERHARTLPAGAPFGTAAFLAGLKAHGAPLPFTSGGKRRAFYERWLRSPAFGLWLARQEEA